jgi:hypothetical protein
MPYVEAAGRGVADVINALGQVIILLGKIVPRQTPPKPPEDVMMADIFSQGQWDPNAWRDAFGKGL